MTGAVTGPRTRGGKRKAASSYPRIYAVVEQIPWGRVSTYGEVARRAGLPGAARQVGYALHALPEDSAIPWQRVINSRGEVSLRSELGFDCIQRQMLEAEGVVFDRSGRVDFSRFGWNPVCGRAPRGGSM